MTATQPLGDSVDNPLVDMVAGQQFGSPVSVALALACALALAACGAVTCPEPLSSVGGTCEKVDPVPAGEPGAEACDGVDNDGDDAIDEDFPELGEPCGEGLGVGECVAGTFVCAPGGRGVVCEGAVGPTPEVCDGKDNDCDGTPDNGPAEVCDGVDNDCDGLVDEGALALKSESYGDLVTVTAVEGGFVVSRVVADQVRIETYDLTGTRTGHHDDIARPADAIAFIASDSAGERVLVALGQHTFHVLEVHVDPELIPVIVASETLHEDWQQPTKLGVHDPPYHPRVVASPPRFVGYRDLITFAMSPFSDDALFGLRQSPTLTAPLPVGAEFDVEGPFVVWQQADNLRAALLLDDGSFLVEIDVARGVAPSLAIADGGPALLSIQDGGLRLSELGGLTLTCLDGRFCNDPLEAPELEAGAMAPTALAYDERADAYFAAAGSTLLALGRAEGKPVVKQAEVREVGGEPPVRIDVAVSGGSAAFVQTARNDDSALTFMGCL